MLHFVQHDEPAQYITIIKVTVCRKNLSHASKMGSLCQDDDGR